MIQSRMAKYIPNLSDLSLPDSVASALQRIQVNAQKLPVLPTLAAGVGTVVVWYGVSRWHQLKQYPPGPSPWPLIGNLGYLMDDDKKIWEVFTELQQQYGDIFTIYMGPTPTVILGNLDLVREGFLTKQNDFAGRPRTWTFDVLTKSGKDIAMGQFGSVWKRQRKICHAAMRKFASGEILANLVHNSTRKIYKEMDKHADTGKAFDPKQCLNLIIYNIIASMVFGKTYEYDDPFLNDFIGLNDNLTEKFGAGLLVDFFPIFKHVKTNTMKMIEELSEQAQKLIVDAYNEHEKSFDESNLRDLVDYVIHSKQEAEQKEGKAATEGITLEHFQMTILDIFTAGTDTSRLTLIWAVLYLAAYPEVQRKLQQEVDAIVDHEQALKIDDQARLPYTEAFLHELMRMRPVAPIALPHVTMCDTSVGGHKIPKGTTVMPNYWAIHMDPKHWEDPTTFKPERFLNDDGKMLPRISSWLPFSTGRRVCVGEAVAKSELHLTLASLVQRYNFAAPPGVTMDTSVKATGQGMMNNDYEIVLTRRK